MEDNMINHEKSNVIKNKSKKFNAAEEHFKQKELKMRHELKRYEMENCDLTDANSRLVDTNLKLQKENDRLETENNKLKVEIEISLKLMNLTQTQIDAIAHKCTSLASIEALFGTIGSAFRY